MLKKGVCAFFLQHENALLSPRWFVMVIYYCNWCLLFADRYPSCFRCRIQRTQDVSNLFQNVLHHIQLESPH